MLERNWGRSVCSSSSPNNLRTSTLPVKAPTFPLIAHVCGGSGLKSLLHVVPFSVCDSSLLIIGARLYYPPINYIRIFRDLVFGPVDKRSSQVVRAKERWSLVWSHWGPFYFPALWKGIWPLRWNPCPNFEVGPVIIIITIVSST